MGNVWHIILLATAAFTFSIAGCGFKTLPIPPKDAIPNAIEDLSYQQQGSQLILSWTYPNRTTVGTRLQNIEAFQIYRAVIPEEDFCKGCPVQYSTITELATQDVIIDEKKRRAQYTESVLRPNHRYLYSVRTKAGWRLISDESNPISIAWSSPAGAPSGVQAKPGDREIMVSWQPVVNDLNGAKTKRDMRYQVLRSVVGDDFSPVGSLVAGSSYSDKGLVNGRKYHYKVQAVQVKDGTRIVGMASRTATAVPKDMTAPAPPTTRAS